MKELKQNDDFIMSPKVDFVFKLLFGDQKNIDLLQALLAAILNVHKDELNELTIIDSELLMQFKGDKKGILDVRAITKSGEEINIEIQVLNNEYMAERSLFYWGKMYTGKIKSGEDYDQMKKCININIVDYECIPLNKIHSTYHILEDEDHYRLSDVLELHYLELPKLKDDNIKKDENEAIIQWLEFINAKTKEVMEMLATKNNDIEKAYNKLQEISQDDIKRREYLAREMFLHDQVTRERVAREKGIEKGILLVAKNLLDIMDDKTIAEKTGLSVDKVRKLRKI